MTGIACATVKITTAAMKPRGDTVTPGTSHAAASSPIAEEPQKDGYSQQEAGSREELSAYGVHHGRKGRPPSLPSSSRLTASTWCSCTTLVSKPSREPAM